MWGMKKKVCKRLVVVLVFGCAVLGMTGCRDRGSLAVRIAEQARNAIASMREGNKGEGDTETEEAGAAAGQEEADTSGESTAITSAGENADKKNTAKENAGKGNTDKENTANKASAGEDIEENDTDNKTNDKTNTAQAKESAQEPQIYLEKYPLYSDAYWTKPVIDTDYDTVHADKKTFPELARALEAYSDEGASVVAAWENENREAAQAEREEYGEDYPPYTFRRRLSIMRADSQVVSILCEDSWKLGGMMGSVDYTVSGKNIHPLTGKDLALEEVVADISQLKRILIEEFYRQRPEENSYLGYFANVEDLIASQFEKNQPRENQPVWVLGCQGITFCYNQGVLTEGRGSLEITLLYEKYPELFQPPFQKEPEEFAQYDEWGEWKVDLDHDGQIEELYIMDVPSDNMMGNRICFYLDDEMCFEQKEEYLSLEDKYLLKNKDGDYYVYLVTSEVDEVSRILVYRLTRDGIAYQGEIYGWLTGLVTSPSHFDVGDRIGVLSNRVAYQHYHMGNDGIPQADDEIYYLYGWEEDDSKDDEFWTYTVTTKKPLPAYKIFEDGTVSSTKENIPAGVKCQPIRTDQKTFVDLLAQDGRRWRIDYRINEDWTRTIWGEDENEYFLDIVYAG